MLVTRRLASVQNIVQDVLVRDVSVKILANLHARVVMTANAPLQHKVHVQDVNVKSHVAKSRSNEHSYDLYYLHHLYLSTCLKNSDVILVFSLFPTSVF